MVVVVVVSKMKTLATRSILDAKRNALLPTTTYYDVFYIKMVVIDYYMKGYT